MFNEYPGFISGDFFELIDNIYCLEFSVDMIDFLLGYGQ